MKKLGGFWGLQESGMNETLLFAKEVACKTLQTAVFFTAGADIYKVFVNGKTVFFGPSRTARGYAIENRFEALLQKGRNVIAVLVNSYHVATFSNMKREPFFRITVETDGERLTTEDFACFAFEERIRNAQRYSFQRGFSEAYEMEADFPLLVERYLESGKRLPLLPASTEEILPEEFPLSPPRALVSAEKVSGGRFQTDETLPVWQDRSISQVGNCFEGYPRERLFEVVTDTVCRFRYTESETGDALRAGEYALFAFPRNLSGLLGVTLSVEEDAEIYLTFDERTAPSGERVVDPVRLVCANVVKWKLKRGEYDLQTLEVYTCRYMQLNVTAGAVRVKKANVTLVQNENIYRFSAKVEDEAIERIFEAAQHTCAQNSFDMIMDCPSRERACWSNDLYYSRQCMELFEGGRYVVNASLRGYFLYGKLPQLPDGILPMCYPSDHLNGEYMPNCSLWHVLTLCASLKEGLGEWTERAKAQIYGVLGFLEKYENEDGLLENLDGAAFIEWSMANNAEFVKGVNYPTNMLYCKALRAVAEQYGDERLQAKAARIKEEIVKQSFNGAFFEDNRVRENGVLTLKGHISEACQYFAYFSGVATAREFPDWYERMKKEFGPFRNAKECYPHIDRANIITGLLKRLDMLLENGEFALAVEETREIFARMAIATNTLWENTAPTTSCNHGIAGYSACVLFRALTGFVGFKEERPIFREGFYGKLDCEFTLPRGEKRYYVRVKNGKRTVEEIC